MIRQFRIRMEQDHCAKVNQGELLTLSPTLSGLKTPCDVRSLDAEDAEVVLPQCHD
jgi:hypothetical protein